jgi:adenosine deaminase
MSSTWSVLPLAALLLSAGCAARGPRATVTPAPAASSREAATAATFERLRNDPVLRRVFLRDMPKGGDLHVHVSGAIYAETFARWAVDDGLCVDAARLAFTRPPCDAPLVPASRLVTDDDLYDRIIDALSMRNWHPARNSGHSQFFDSFSKFSAATRGRMGDMLAAITSRAAAQRLSYVELMYPVDDNVARRMAAQVPWTGDMASMREALLAAGMREALQQARRTLDATEARHRELLKCATPQADAGCAVTVRYQLPALRASSPGEVFTQFLSGFEMATLDSRVVAVNIAQPEDGLVARRDFRLHMDMLDYLHAQYPRVGIALHAGELIEGLVPPEDLRFHIRSSIERGHARRIGHGAAVMHEDGALDLLRTMAAERILVEVALSSSDGILGLRGAQHPLKTYLAFGVPVALSTDDEGVSRSSITREYERAVEEHGLDYPTLKAMARASLQYGFVEAPEKERLLREFDAAIAAFETAWASVPRP